MTDGLQGAQAELDDLARANSWQVSSYSYSPVLSVYTRGPEMLSLFFQADGTAVVSVTRNLDLGEKDWKGRVGNILRKRWRTRNDTREQEEQ